MLRGQSPRLIWSRSCSDATHARPTIRPRSGALHHVHRPRLVKVSEDPSFYQPLRSTCFFALAFLVFDCGRPVNQCMIFQICPHELQVGAFRRNGRPASGLDYLRVFTASHERCRRLLSHWWWWWWWWGDLCWLVQTDS